MGSKKKPEPVNHLRDNAWVNPCAYRTTMTRDQLRDTLLYHDGRILAAGAFWAIKSKHLGAGVYAVTLQEDSRNA